MTDRICSTPGCPRPYRARGYCIRCYEAARASGALPLRRDLDPRVSIAERFEKFCGEPTTDGCIPWRGQPDRDGYGELWVEQCHTSVRAHRVALWLRDGSWPDPDGVVDHECHRPTECSGGSDCPHRRCVNTEHMIVTSSSVNGSAARRSALRGERHPRTLLSEADVRAIRDACGAGASQRSIASRYGLGPGAVSAIVRRATWKHVA